MEAGNMALSDRNFLKKIEEDLIKYLLFGFLGLIGTGIIFYFDTKNTDKHQSQQMEKLEFRVGNIETKIDKIVIEPQLNTEQINSIKKTVDEMRDRQQRLEQRQDKIYDLILEMSKNK